MGMPKTRGSPHHCNRAPPIFQGKDLGTRLTDEVKFYSLSRDLTLPVSDSSLSIIFPFSSSSGFCKFLTASTLAELEVLAASLLMDLSSCPVEKYYETLINCIHKTNWKIMKKFEGHNKSLFGKPLVYSRTSKQVILVISKTPELQRNRPLKKLLDCLNYQDLLK